MSDNETSKMPPSGVDNDTTHDDARESLAGRRRFLKGAVAATPIILTVANRPAWGGGRWGGGNLCWSGIQSGNLSQDNKDNCEFGLSPGYYKVNVTKVPGWPGPYHDMFDYGCDHVHSNGTISDRCKELFQDVSAVGVPGTTFGAVFIGATGYLASKTLMQVLWQDSGSFAFHAIATYFNALNFPNYTFSPDTALEIINDILSTGVHTDDTGMIWSEGEMKDLFSSLYH